MTVFAGPDPVIPKNLKEVSRSCLGELAEVPTQLEFFKEACRSGSIGIPSSPDPRAVGLTRWSECLHAGRGEFNLMPILKLFHGLQKDQIGGA